MQPVTTDPELFASRAGGQAVIDWFGYCPDFHDARLERFEIANGDATLLLRAFRVTNDVDTQGFFVLDRHVLVTLHLRHVTGLKLEGDAQSIISELTIRRLPERPASADWSTCAGPDANDIEIAFETAIGLRGEIYGQDLSFELEPTSPLSRTRR